MIRMLDCAHLRHLQSRVVSRSARIHTSFFVWFYLSCCVKLCECDRLYSCSAMCMRGMHIGRFNTMKITAQVAQTTWRPNSSMSSSVLPQLLWLLWVQRILGKIRALLRLQHQQLQLFVISIRGFLKVRRPWTYQTLMPRTMPRRPCPGLLQRSQPKRRLLLYLRVHCTI